MTALERLIKLASTDGAAHYRELAKEAQVEYCELRAIKAKADKLVDDRLKYYLDELTNQNEHNRKDIS